MHETRSDKRQGERRCKRRIECSICCDWRGGYRSELMKGVSLGSIPEVRFQKGVRRTQNVKDRNNLSEVVEENGKVLNLIEIQSCDARGEERCVSGSEYFV